jgi:hypothetical protein
MYMQRSKKAFPAAFVVGLALEVQLSLLKNLPDVGIRFTHTVETDDLECCGLQIGLRLEALPLVLASLCRSTNHRG